MVVKIEEVEASSHGVGGSYTVWQRKPPAHGVYRVHTPDGYGMVKAHVEVKIGDDEPSIVKIENDQTRIKGHKMKREREFTDEEIEKVREYLLDYVIPDEDFWSFNDD